MSLIRYTPASLMDAAFNQFFDGFVPDAPNGTEHAVFVPKVDILDEKEAIVISAELPGVSLEDVKVQVENRMLTLSGEKKLQASTEENGIYRSERSYGAFSRSFRLPDLVNSEKIAADFTSGLLTLRIPKRPEAAPREIAINGEAGKVKKIDVK